MYALVEVVVLITHPEQLVCVGVIPCKTLEFVCTKMRYTVAPATPPQSNVGVVEMFIAPLEGLSKTGVGRDPASVVKDQMAEFRLPADELPARTIQ